MRTIPVPKGGTTCLVERVISEEFQHVSVPVLRPRCISVEFRAVHDGVQLCQEPEEPRGLDVLGQLVLEGVGPVVGLVQRHVEARPWNSG